MFDYAHTALSALLGVMLLSRSKVGDCLRCVFDLLYWWFFVFAYCVVEVVVLFSL